MSAWMDESEDYLDSESEDYDSESDFDAAPAFAARRARQQQQQVALRRARYRDAVRRSQARPGGLAAPAAAAGPATPRAAVTAIRNLDLKTSVGNDELRRRLDQANRRAEMSSYVTLASSAVNQVLDTFEDSVGSNRWVRSGLRIAPLLLLSPVRSRTGLAATALHPAVLGVVAVGGIAAAGELVNRDRGVKIALLHDRVSHGDGSASGHLSAKVTDRDGRPIGATPTYRSLDPKILDVKPDGGYKTQAAGVGRVVVVEVTAQGKTELFHVAVDA